MAYYNNYTQPDEETLAFFQGRSLEPQQQEEVAPQGAASQPQESPGFLSEVGSGISHQMRKRAAALHQTLSAVVDDPALSRYKEQQARNAFKEAQAISEKMGTTGQIASELTGMGMDIGTAFVPGGVAVRGASMLASNTLGTTSEIINQQMQAREEDPSKEVDVGKAWGYGLGAGAVNTALGTIIPGGRLPTKIGTGAAVGSSSAMVDQTAVNLATDRPWEEGQMMAATGGAILGGGFAGGAAAIERRLRKADPETDPNVPGSGLNKGGNAAIKFISSLKVGNKDLKDDTVADYIAINNINQRYNDALTNPDLSREDRVAIIKNQLDANISAGSVNAALDAAQGLDKAMKGVHKGIYKTNLETLDGNSIGSFGKALGVSDRAAASGKKVSDAAKPSLFNTVDAQNQGITKESMEASAKTAGRAFAESFSNNFTNLKKVIESAKWKAQDSGMDTRMYSRMEKSIDELLEAGGSWSSRRGVPLSAVKSSSEELMEGLVNTGLIKHAKSTLDSERPFNPIQELMTWKYSTEMLSEIAPNWREGTVDLAKEKPSTTSGISLMPTTTVANAIKGTINPFRDLYSQSRLKSQKSDTSKMLERQRAKLESQSLAARPKTPKQAGDEALRAGNMAAAADNYEADLMNKVDAVETPPVNSVVTGEPVQTKAEVQTIVSEQPPTRSGVTLAGKGVNRPEQFSDTVRAEREALVAQEKAAADAKAAEEAVANLENIKAMARGGLLDQEGLSTKMTKEGDEYQVVRDAEHQAQIAEQKSLESSAAAESIAAKSQESVNLARQQAAVSRGLSTKAEAKARELEATQIGKEEDLGRIARENKAKRDAEREGLKSVPKTSPVASKAVSESEKSAKISEAEAELEAAKKAAEESKVTQAEIEAAQKAAEAKRKAAEDTRALRTAPAKKQLSLDQKAKEAETQVDDLVAQKKMHEEDLLAVDKAKRSLEFAKGLKVKDEAPSKPVEDTSPEIEPTTPEKVESPTESVTEAPKVQSTELVRKISAIKEDLKELEPTSAKIVTPDRYIELQAKKKELERLQKVQDTIRKLSNSKRVDESYVQKAYEELSESDKKADQSLLNNLLSARISEMKAADALAGGEAGKKAAERAQKIADDAKKRIAEAAEKAAEQAIKNKHDSLRAYAKEKSLKGEDLARFFETRGIMEGDDFNLRAERVALLKYVTPKAEPKAGPTIHTPEEASIRLKSLGDGADDFNAAVDKELNLYKTAGKDITPEVFLRVLSKVEKDVNTARRVKAGELQAEANRLAEEAKTEQARLDAWFKKGKTDDVTGEATFKAMRALIDRSKKEAEEKAAESARIAEEARKEQERLDAWFTSNKTTDVTSEAAFKASQNAVNRQLQEAKRMASESERLSKEAAEEQQRLDNWFTNGKTEDVVSEATFKTMKDIIARRKETSARNAAEANRINKQISALEKARKQADKELTAEQVKAEAEAEELRLQAEELKKAEADMNTLQEQEEAIAKTLRKAGADEVFIESFLLANTGNSYGPINEQAVATRGVKEWKKVEAAENTVLANVSAQVDKTLGDLTGEQIEGAVNEIIKVLGKANSDIKNLKTLSKLLDTVIEKKAIVKGDDGKQAVRVAAAFKKSLDEAAKYKAEFPNNPELWLSRDTYTQIQSAYNKTGQAPSSYGGPLLKNLRSMLYSGVAGAEKLASPEGPTLSSDALNKLRREERNKEVKDVLGDDFKVS